MEYRTDKDSSEENKAVITGSALVRSIACTNNSASSRYLHSFDGASTSGSRFATPVRIDPEQTFVFNFTPKTDGLARGRKVTTGLYLAASSTLKVFAASGAADFIFDVEWEPVP